MQAALQKGFNYQLQLMQLSFLQQQQQAYIAAASQPYLFQDLIMTTTIKEEQPVISNTNGSTVDALAYAESLKDLQLGQSRRCDLCCLSFSSPIVLKAHVSGSKHQRKVRSIELLKSLEERKEEFVRDEISGVIRCIVCNITVNSPQLLATHMAGNKHKVTAEKRKRTHEAEEEGQEGGKKKKKKSGGQPSEQSTLPPYVYCAVPKGGNGSSLYVCSLCGAHCNSSQQLKQHLDSSKHQHKIQYCDYGQTWQKDETSEGNLETAAAGDDRAFDGSSQSATVARGGYQRGRGGPEGAHKSDRGFRGRYGGQWSGDIYRGARVGRGRFPRGHRGGRMKIVGEQDANWQYRDPNWQGQDPDWQSPDSICQGQDLNWQGHDSNWQSQDPNWQGQDLNWASHNPHLQVPGPNWQFQDPNCQGAEANWQVPENRWGYNSFGGRRRIARRGRFIK